MESMFNILRSYTSFTMIYYSYQKEWRLKNAVSLLVICIIKKYVAHITTLKKALNSGLMLKNVYRVIQFNQKALLKP